MNDKEEVQNPGSALGEAIGSQLEKALNKCDSLSVRSPLPK